jgi:hypothetical protein
VEHFELESHLSPSPRNQEASSRLSKVEAHVCKVVDPIDGQSVENLANILAVYNKEVFVRACAEKPCYDIDFREWVMRDDDFFATCRPSGAELRSLLQRLQLSLIPIPGMYRRIIRILGETCRQSAALNNRDSAVDVGDDDSASGDNGPVGDTDEVMIGTYEHTGTVNPQHLARGVNHDGIGGTQSSEARGRHM